MKKLSIAVLLLFSMLSISPSKADALTIDLQGANYSYLTGTADWSYSFDAALGLGSLNLTLSNTSTDNSLITGWAMNAPSGITGLAAFSGPDGWGGTFALDSINTPQQFGRFDFAGLSGKNFNGGDPKEGIAVNESANFSLLLSGDQNILSGLTEASFLLKSYFDNVSANPVEFIARIQNVGPDGALSDVLIPTDPAAPVPEPGTFMLSGLGLAAIVFARRRHNATS